MCVFVFVFDLYIHNIMFASTFFIVEYEQQYFEYGYWCTLLVSGNFINAR